MDISRLGEPTDLTNYKESPAVVDVGSDQGIVVACQTLVQPTVIVVPVDGIKMRVRTVFMTAIARSIVSEAG